MVFIKSNHMIVAPLLILIVIGGLNSRWHLKKLYVSKYFKLFTGFCGIRLDKCQTSEMFLICEDIFLNILWNILLPSLKKTYYNISLV